MSSPLSRSFAVLLPGVVLLLACVALLARCGGDDAPESLPDLPVSLAKLNLDGVARGGRFALELRGPGGPPVDITVPTHPGDSAQTVADRLVEEMRKTAWSERDTWKPWIVGLRIMHVDEVLFRNTDVGLHVRLSMGTWPPTQYGVVVRGAESETAPGILIVYGASNLESPESRARRLEAAMSSKEPIMQYLQQMASDANGSDSPAGVVLEFEAGQSSVQLFDRLAQRLTDGQWMVEGRGESLVCNAIPNGGALTHMSVYVRRGRGGEGVDHAADWTWGLTLVRP